MDQQRLHDVFNALHPTRLYEGAKELVLTTSIEVPVMAALLGIFAFTASYHHENAKRGQIPLAFSEIGASRLYIEQINHRRIPPLTNYYSALNDMVMMIFEANNLAYTQWDGSDKKFAYELEKKIDQSMRVHTLYTDYTPRFPGYVAGARQSIKPFTDADQDLAPIIEALDEAWHESHRDVTHTETKEVCDSDGKNCHNEDYEVYDYTIHRYRYDNEQGVKSVQLLKAFALKHPDIHIAEELIKPWKTEAENEWAIRESRRRLPGYKPPTHEQYMSMARSWATGSNYEQRGPVIYQSHGEVLADTPVWETSRKLSHNHRYTTTSRTDSGPEEFQVAEAALADARNLSQNIGMISGGITLAANNVMPLQVKMQRFVDIELHGGKGNGHKLRGEIMREARALYAANYSGGFDTQPSKWGMVVLWTFMGLALGGLLGLGLDKLGQRVQGDSYTRRTFQNMSAARYQP